MTSSTNTDSSFKKTPQARPSDEFIAHDTNSLSTSYKLINALVVPRPIALITSQTQNGLVNAAPFSYFNVVCTNPLILSCSCERRNKERKDTARNILALKEFVVNICSVDLAHAISIASGDFPPDISEIELARLTTISSEKISVPRVANSLAHMECVLSQWIEIGDCQADLILGRVVKVHLHKSILDSQGNVAIEKLNPLARLAGLTFAHVKDFFDVPRGF